MKHIICLLAFGICSFVLRSQNQERKIVIDNGCFYYTTIHEEFQVASLHIGSFKANEPFRKSTTYALPAGRNYSDPTIPFVWDVSGSNCFAMNWAQHPMIDRNEALKLIPIKQLHGWDDKTTPQNMLMQSAEYNSITPNIPYQFVMKKSNVMKNFFFDALMLNDSTFCMAIGNNDEFSYWVYNGKAWDHLEVGNVLLGGYFSLFSKGNDVYIVFSDGRVFSISPKTIKPLPEKFLKTELSTGLLIINKDEHTVKFIKNDQIDANTPVRELINKKAILIL